MANRYCPRCRGQFQRSMQTCPDCGETLVDEPPPSDPKDPKEKRKTKRREDPLVRVAVAPNEPLAKMWAEVLENEGIHSVVKSRGLMASMYVPSLLSACEIHVLASQAEKAKEVLAPFLEDT